MFSSSISVTCDCPKPELVLNAKILMGNKKITKQAVWLALSAYSGILWETLTNGESHES